jgi:hypothetical protein
LRGYLSRPLAHPGFADGVRMLACMGMTLDV